MKQKILMLLAAVLLGCASAFAQSETVDPSKGDVNGDGVVDVADVNAIIGIMKDGGGTVTVGGYFYFGITEPTAENYQTLEGVIDSYTSIGEASGATATVTDGDVLYMLCPKGWMQERSAEIELENEETIYFSDDVDLTTISGYAIYKTQVLNTSSTATLKTIVTNKWFKGDTDPATLDYVGQTKTAWDTWTTATSITGTKVILEDDDLNDHTWYFAFPQSWNVTTMLSSDNYTPVPATTYTITNNVSIAGSLFTVFKMNSASDAIAVYFRSEPVAKKYVYAGQTNPLEEGFSFDNITHDGTSVIKQEVTTKVQVNIGLSSSTRDYWYIAVPNDLGYTLYDSTGSINAETAMDSSTHTIEGITYKVYVTAVKSVALNQVVK